MRMGGLSYEWYDRILLIFPQRTHRIIEPFIMLSCFTVLSIR